MRMHMGIDIEAPPEIVWPYLVEPEKAMSWYTMLTVFDWTDEDRGPGATFYWEEEVRGKTYWNHFRTTEWEPNRVFGWEMTESSFFKGYTERWSIEPTVAGCRFSFDDNLVFPYGVWGKVMGFFGEKMARKSSQQILENIKRLAEAEARVADTADH
jgi:uncharacterized protein YndB with AHSA1/START domain